MARVSNPTRLVFEGMTKREIGAFREIARIENMTQVALFRRWVRELSVQYGFYRSTRELSDDWPLEDQFQEGGE